MSDYCSVRDWMTANLRRVPDNPVWELGTECFFRVAPGVTFAEGGSGIALARYPTILGGYHSEKPIGTLVFADHGHGDCRTEGDVERLEKDLVEIALSDFEVVSLAGLRAMLRAEAA